MKKKGTRSAPKVLRQPLETAETTEPEWNFRLYIAGRSSKSDTAFRNLQQICQVHLPGRYNIDVIDLVKNPKMARENQIVAVPMVVRERPLPIRTIIGDMSNRERAVAGLDLLSLGLKGVRKSRIVN